MRTSHLEVERTFAPAVEAPLPALTDVRTVVAVAPAGEARLEATYYDTSDSALLDAGVTLRRRVGGADQGWHLKLPVAGSDGAREEVHLPLDTATEGDQPPGELAWLVAGWTGGESLAPAAQLRTLRRTTRLLGKAGTVLAELADDRVEGRPARPDAQPTYWREWEVELVDGRPRLLDDVEELFADHGVQRSAVQRKVAVVLGEPTPLALAEPRPKRPARLALHAVLAEQVRTLAVLDPAVRLGRPEGVHGVRKACRRLRSVLAAYRPLLLREHTDPLRDELGWLARSLGMARDEEVVLGRIEAQLAEQPEELVDASAHAQLAARRAGRAERDRDELGAVLASARYRELRVALAALVAAPPWSELADEPAREVLPGVLRHEWKRLRTVHRRAADHAEDQHEVRKAAKRLRYAYEVVEPLWPEVRRARHAARDLTEVLGDRQDGVVAQGVLASLAAEAAQWGQSGLVWGRLHALEETRAPELDAQADRAWRRLVTRRW